MEISRYWIDEIIYMYDKGSDVDDIYDILMWFDEVYEENVDISLSEIVSIIELWKDGYSVVDIYDVLGEKNPRRKSPFFEV